MIRHQNYTIPRLLRPEGSGSENGPDLACSERSATLQICNVYGALHGFQFSGINYQRTRRWALNRSRHNFLSFSYRIIIFLCMVASLCAAFVVPVRSQAKRNSGHTPVSASTAGALGSLFPERENTTTGKDSFSPTAIDTDNWQEDEDLDINWAWLALPALLGMLLITLRRRGGRER
jgi:hypothetical protein